MKIFFAIVKSLTSTRTQKPNICRTTKKQTYLNIKEYVSNFLRPRLAVIYMTNSVKGQHQQFLYSKLDLYELSCTLSYLPQKSWSCLL